MFDDDDDNDGDLDAEEDLEDAEITNGEDTFGDETFDDGASAETPGASAQAGDPDEFAPESSVPADVVDEIDTGGQALPNTGGMSLLAILAPIGGFLLLCFAVLRRIRGNS